MSNVFLAYKSVDVDRANVVRTKLEALGVPLFIDQKLRSGDNYLTTINKELSLAKAVLVLWTEAAVHMPEPGDPPNFVLSEAERGYYRGILVAATFDKMVLNRLPVPFNLFQAAELSEWITNGASAKHPDWQKVLQGLAGKLNRPGLADLAIALETEDSEVKQKFLSEYPADPSVKQVADQLEGIVRKEFDERVSTAQRRIQQRATEAEENLKSCRDQFEAQMAELRAGRTYMPPDPLNALDDNVAKLLNQIEIHRDTIEELRESAKQTRISAVMANTEALLSKQEPSKAVENEVTAASNQKIAELQAEHWL